MRSRQNQKKQRPGETPPCSASQSLVDLALETWRFRQTAERCLPDMDPLDAERFVNGFEWYLRKVRAVLDEAGLTAVNLEDFYEGAGLPLVVAQTVEPVIMEKGNVRRAGSVLLREEIE